MGYKVPKRPPNIENALQGLAFWIGHRHSIFRHYPLPEGAIVTEVCNLVQAGLRGDEILQPECMYRNLVEFESGLGFITPNARADLVLLSDNGVNALKEKENINRFLHFVFEVKRWSAGAAAINSDLLRLYDLLCSTNRDIRAFLIIVSESKSPGKYVKDGKSATGVHKIPGCDGYYIVRRTLKASSSFKSLKSANYACLVEVFYDKPVKRPVV